MVLRVGSFNEDQEINIGIRQQLTATITADGNQRNSAFSQAGQVFVPAEALPTKAQDVIDKRSTGRDQLRNAHPIVEVRVLVCSKFSQSRL